MLVLPPTNHLAFGAFHSSTLSHFLNQCSSSAALPQNCSGLSIDSRYMRSYSARLLIRACAANDGGGGNSRCSCRTESMAETDWVMQKLLEFKTTRGDIVPSYGWQEDAGMIRYSHAGPPEQTRTGTVHQRAGQGRAFHFPRGGG